MVTIGQEDAEIYQAGFDGEILLMAGRAGRCED